MPQTGQEIAKTGQKDGRTSLARARAPLRGDVRFVRPDKTGPEPDNKGGQTVAFQASSAEPRHSAGGRNVRVRMEGCNAACGPAARQPHPIRRCIEACAQPGRDGRWCRHRERECANRLRQAGTSPLIAACTARAAAAVGQAVAQRVAAVQALLGLRRAAQDGQP